MKKEDRINLVIKALKEAGYNDKLEADGEVGAEAKEAVVQFLFNRGRTPSNYTWHPRSHSL